MTRTRAKYQGIESPVLVPGVSAEEAAEMPKIKPGQSFAMKQMGEAAQVGIRVECWIIGGNSMLNVDVYGNVALSFRLSTYRYDSVGVHTRQHDDGTLKVDYDDARLINRRKGWLRVDPILARMDIPDVSREGIPSDAALQRADFVHALTERFKDPDVMSAVYELNDAHPGSEYVKSFGAKLASELSAALESRSRDMTREDRLAIVREAQDNLKKWRDVLEAVATNLE